MAVERSYFVSSFAFDSIPAGGVAAGALRTHTHTHKCGIGRWRWMPMESPKNLFIIFWWNYETETEQFRDAVNSLRSFQFDVVNACGFCWFVPNTGLCRTQTLIERSLGGWGTGERQEPRQTNQLGRNLLLRMCGGVELWPGPGYRYTLHSLIHILLCVIDIPKPSMDRNQLNCVTRLVRLWRHLRVFHFCAF